MSFRNRMFISSIQYTPYQRHTTPNFQGRKAPIGLDYVLKNHMSLLPERVSNQVKKIISQNSTQTPTLKDIHKQIYSPLLECKTLAEAQKLFPEFANMSEADISFKRITGNIKKLKTSGALENNFSLKMLQEFWGNLKSQDEVAKELGLKDRSAIQWVLQKIGFVNYKSNYKTLLMSSDPETRAVISAKTVAWNAAHPDLMYAKNKHAAQFCKTQEYRDAHSLRMKEYDKAHPERREKISAYDKKVWDLCPEIKAAMTDYKNAQSNAVKAILNKQAHKDKLTTDEKRIIKSFYKGFWQNYPELRQVFKEAHAKVKKEM